MNRLMSSPIVVRHNPAFAAWTHSAPAIESHTNVCGSIVYLAADIPGADELIREAGWQVEKLASLDALAVSPETGTPSCVVVDISGSHLESSGLPRQLAGLDARTPFICTTDEVNLAMLVEIVKAGAIDVLWKTGTGDALLGAIRTALHRSEAALQQSQTDRRLAQRFATLSPRERQVLVLASSGLLNKQIAGELGISEITVKAHRGSVMRKMQAQSFAGLVKMAMALAL